MKHLTINDKNLNSEIETIMMLRMTNSKILTINDKNLNSEIETCYRCCPRFLLEYGYQR